MRKLSDKAIITNSVGTIVSALFFAAFAGFFLLASVGDSGGGDAANVSALPVGWIIAGVVIAILLAVGYSVLWVRLFGYKLADKEVKIEKGVISKSYDSIPYSRIQNVGIDRSLLERILGLSTLNIHTAGHSGQGSGAEGNIPGVKKDQAEEVRESIMEKARGEEGGGL